MISLSIGPVLSHTYWQDGCSEHGEGIGEHREEVENGKIIYLASTWRVAASQLLPYWELGGVFFSGGPLFTFPILPFYLILFLFDPCCPLWGHCVPEPMSSDGSDPDKKKTEYTV